MILEVKQIMYLSVWDTENKFQRGWVRVYVTYSSTYTASEVSVVAEFSRSGPAPLMGLGIYRMLSVFQHPIEIDMADYCLIV